MTMELYQSCDQYILVDGDACLICSRLDGSLTPSTTNDISASLNVNTRCLGVVYGVVGKIHTHPESHPRLILIRQRSLVGSLMAKHDIYRISKVLILSLSLTDKTDLDIDTCPQHGSLTEISFSNEEQKPLFKTWNSLKTAAGNVKSRKKEVKEKERFKKRILEELQKMFNEPNWFFYSQTYDLTSRIQRQHEPDYDSSLPCWQRADDRFFWNRFMLSELIDDGKPALASHWIIPIMHGYMQMETCHMDFTENHSDEADHMTKLLESAPTLHYNLSIISRRSRYRAGTRSRKRGIDENGHCANYVETEQIVEFYPHMVAFTQVRGSAPVFWSQTGFKYRPPPNIDRGINDTHEAFLSHIHDQLREYVNLVAINLTELLGKESTIAEHFLHHVLRMNHPDMTFVAFDFHEYCRGLKFENVSILMNVIKDVIQEMRYTWFSIQYCRVDDRGMICSQNGIFRINCMDCLDRTNVVQMAIARVVLETQVRKLGLLPPDQTLPPSCQNIFQQMWANMGDVISRQYAGTAALKTDFTRTGERKLTGLMKDGMKSANRYYLRFRDAYRQAAIDLILGQSIDEDLLSHSEGGSNQKAYEVDAGVEAKEKEETLRELMEDCKTMLVLEPEQCLATWGVVDADPIFAKHIIIRPRGGNSSPMYDDDNGEFTRFQRIFLEDITHIETGYEASMLRSKFMCMRVHYRNLANEGYFHTFRSPSIRVFNNALSLVKTHNEARDCLQDIIDSLSAALGIFSLPLNVVVQQKLDRKRSKPHPNLTNINQKIQETSLTTIPLPVQTSEIDLPTMSSTPPQFSPKLKRFIKGTKNGIKTKTSELKSHLSSRTKTAFSILNLNFNNNDAKTRINIEMLKKFNPLNKIRDGRNIFDKKISFRRSSSVYTRREDTLTSYNSSEERGSDEIMIPTLCLDNKITLSEETVDLLPGEDSKADDDISLDDQEVVLGSCGILATSGSRLLLTSLSIDEDDCVNDQTAKMASNIPPLSTIHTSVDNLDLSLMQTFSNDTLPVGNITGIQSSSDFDGVADVPTVMCIDPTSFVASQDRRLVIKGLQHEVDSDNTPHHPRIKASLSEGALTKQPKEGGSLHNDAIESKTMTKLRLQLPNIVLPLSLNKAPQKNQHTSHFVQKIMIDEIGTRECMTKVIFI